MIQNILIIFIGLFISMKYDTFKKVILERLSRDIPDPKKILVQSIQKNNGCVLDGLVILENDCNISPTIYLNYYYEHYQNSGSFQDVYQQIVRSYQKNKPTQRIDARFFTDFKNTRSKIMYKLINYEKNQSLLQDVPHVRFLDLAIVFYCLISVNKEIGYATILIHNSHLEYWDITEEQLFQIARENTCRALPPRLHDMDHLIDEIADKKNEPLPDLPDTMIFPMLVLTNQSNLFGAACILYEDLLQSFAQKMNSDLYILPSSVHEVILIPADNDSSLADFSEMVHEVNLSQLNREEVLSDHAYYYSLKENIIKK